MPYWESNYVTPFRFRSNSSDLNFVKNFGINNKVKEILQVNKNQSTPCIAMETVIFFNECTNHPFMDTTVRESVWILWKKQKYI